MESAFSKPWGHSYKHESFTKMSLFLVKFQASTRNFIGNVKYNWVFFQQIF